MVNSNPETVSTDYDTSDKLFFEPLTLEDVLNICRPRKARRRHRPVRRPDAAQPRRWPQGQAGVPIIGTSVESIERAEDRKLFQQMLDKLDLSQPPNGIATNEDEARGRRARSRLSRARAAPASSSAAAPCRSSTATTKLRHYMRAPSPPRPSAPSSSTASSKTPPKSTSTPSPTASIAVIGGIMEHIEQAGVHCGDSACVIPAPLSSDEIQDEIREATTKALARELDVRGLMNVQFAVKDESSTSSKSTRAPPAPCPSCPRPSASRWPSWPPKSCWGSLKDLGFTEEIMPPYSVKEAVFPFAIPAADHPGAGDENTGEVMGIDDDFGLAYAKSQMAAGQVLPLTGGVLFSVKDPDKPLMAPLVKGFKDLGFQVYATRGTAQCLKKQGVEVEEVYKIREARPNIIDRIKNREIALVINTPRGRHTPEDSYSIRRAALEYNVPYTTTLAAAKATLHAIRTLKDGKLEVKSLQEYHEMMKRDLSD